MNLFINEVNEKKKNETSVARVSNKYHHYYIEY